MDCKWPTKPTKCCWVSCLVKQATASKNHEKNCNLRTMSCEYDCLAKIGIKEAFTLLLGN